MIRRAIKVTAVLIGMVGLVQSASYATLSSHALKERHKQGKLLVVATTGSLADIAKYVGGEKVYITSLTTSFPAKSEPKAGCRSVVNALKEAKVLLRLGDAYDPWINKLVEDSGNNDIAIGSKGYVDTSCGIAGIKNPSCGHATYYWLDPENAKIIASNILAAFESIDPKNAAKYRKNYEAFIKKIDEKHEGAKITTCCNVECAQRQK